MVVWNQTRDLSEVCLYNVLCQYITSDYVLDTVSPLIAYVMGTSHFTNVETETEWTTQHQILGK